jgi:signal transduction histidine kinase
MTPTAVPTSRKFFGRNLFFVIGSQNLHRFWGEVAYCLSGSIAVALLTLVCFRFRFDTATVTCLYLIVIVLVSLRGSFLSSTLVSIIAVACLDYYFTPPLFSFQVRDSINIVGIAAFGTTSAVITGLVLRVRRLMEEKLQQSEAYLLEARRLSSIATFSWTASTGKILWSEENFRIFQYDRTAKPTLELVLQRVHPEDVALVKQTIERAWRDGKDFDCEHRLLMPDGSVKYVHIVAHAVRDKSTTLEFVGAVMDVSESKRAEEALRQAQADLERVSRLNTMGELTASVAHEVNQPIAAAVTDANTCVRWLTRGHPDLEEAREAASRMVMDATRAAEIIKRVRLLFDKGTPERELIDMNDIIREMIVLLRNEATQYFISVRTDLAEDLARVMGDRVQLQQVVMNLMINAIDAMKGVDGTPELIIRSQQAEDGQLMVSISDNGIGLPPQHADQIFNAFFTTKVHGTGMGLRISRTIVESHGGRLWASDNSPRGASVCFTLPIKAGAHMSDARS